jgi:hypothetical protein
MNRKLSPADAMAVDLILDRAATAQANGNGEGGTTSFGTASSHARVSNERIAAAEKVLKLLDLVPPHDPTSDLVQRTLGRIEHHTGAPMRDPGQIQIDHGRPVA